MTGSWTNAQFIPICRLRFKFIFKSQILKHLAYIFLTWKWRNWKEEAWKNQSFNGIRTRDLRDTGEMLYQLSYDNTLGVRSIYWLHISREEWNDVKYPVEALIFFRLLLSNFLNWKINCDYLTWVFFLRWEIGSEIISANQKPSKNKLFTKPTWIKIGC